MAGAGKALNSEKANLSPFEEQILGTFTDMREQQKTIVSRLSQVEMDLKEHELVLKALYGLDLNRKCYILIGNALVERKVENVLPDIITKKAKLQECVGALRNSLDTKGAEMVQFGKAHNIQIRASIPIETIDASAAATTNIRQANILAGI